MPIVAVINYKGGVGKTTIVANVAAELAWRGKNVLLVDLDPQASLTFSFLPVDTWRQRYADTTTIRNWYDAFIHQNSEVELADLIVSPGGVNNIVDGRLDLICSHLTLINVDLELATMLGGGTIRQVQNKFLNLHSRLLDGLDDAGVQDRYDYVLIDCPPNFNVVTKTAIVASNQMLIPAIPDYLSTLGIGELQRHVDELVRDFNSYAEQRGRAMISPAILGVVPTMVQVYGGQPISRQAPFIDQIRRSGVSVFDTLIRRNNTMHGDAPLYGVPVVLQTASGATYEAVRSELEDLTSEFVDRLR